MTDINSNKPLDAIITLSSRAFSLVARNQRKPLLQTGYINVMGAIEMLESLEYHHDNVVRIAAELGSGARVSVTHVDHEVVAYLNRVGQFRYFAKSRFVATAVPSVDALIPKISRFMIFRDKHTAHRSIDAPRKKDTEDAKLSHARAVTSIMGSVHMPKPNAEEVIPPPIGVLMDIDAIQMHIQKELWTKTFRSYQTFDTSTGSHVHFTLEAEHPDIVGEAYSVIERVVLFE